jgi:uncharacterized protein YbbC (DUF1343 family)/CubicO group peptidase (beta-lactamase class C family)
VFGTHGNWIVWGPLWTNGTPLLEFLEHRPRVVYSQNIRLIRTNSIAWHLLVLLPLALSVSYAATSAKKHATVTATGQSQLKVLDSIVQDAIGDGQIPGAVLLVGHDGQIVYRKAFGDRSLEPRHEAMTVDTIFDIASLTKVVATTTAVMQLVQKGQIRLSDPVIKYLPEFGENGKEEIRVRDLLTHFSGLPEDLDLSQPWQGRDTGLRMAYAEKPVFPPGSHFLYSDINFIVLGALVERVSEISLDEYCRKNIFVPLGMTHTRFLPPASWLPKIAPTQYDEHDHMLWGEVHDPSARRMGGVAGHAGVFSTADDLSTFAQFLLTGGAVLSQTMIEKMTTPQTPPTAQVLRGFGWDIDSPFSTNRGELLPVGSYGHTGFTGTSLWIDPTTRTYIILLTNAVHPRGKGSAVALRTKVATAVAAALPLTVSEKEELRWKSITGYNEAQTAARRVSNRNGTVLTGIDVLEAHDFALLRGTTSKKKVGLLTNQTGVDSHGRRTIDVLAQAPGISLDAIFSPEHGVTGDLDTTDVANTKDAVTGIPVYSVYGATDAARHPPLEVLKKLDAVVIDIQDAGVRFYTYETSVGYFLEAAAQAGIEIVVLDRPDPVTGSFVQGPVSAPGHESFTNYFSIPVRHGMTIGELAMLFNAERGIHAKLQVIPMEGWMRGDWYDSTGLAWINPSPNLRSMTEVTLYPGVALIEGTNVSVGRGTDTPFELVGAPWVNGRELSQYLNAREISGVRFVPVNFTPNSSNYANQKCEGVNIVSIERGAFDAPELGIELASALQKLYPQQFHIEKMIDLLLDQPTYDAIVKGEDPRHIAADWHDALEKFQAIRQKYLMYK